MKNPRTGRIFEGILIAHHYLNLRLGLRQLLRGMDTVLKFNASIFNSAVEASSIENSFEITHVEQNWLKLNEYYIIDFTDFSTFFECFAFSNNIFKRYKFHSVIILTLSWRGSLSYRNQSIDLQSKSMGWFLYDNGLRHERVKDGIILFLILTNGEKIITCHFSKIITS